jgi:cell division septum initiation protein DivIVA
MKTYPIIIKAIQELSQQNKDLLKRIEDLENSIST